MSSSITEQFSITTTPTAIIQDTTPQIPSIIQKPEILGQDTELLSNIKTFKQDAVTWAKEKLVSEASLLETKEVKDLTAIIDSIEKSVTLKDKEPTQVVNILVQNLMDAKDDC